MLPFFFLKVFTLTKMEAWLLCATLCTQLDTRRWDPSWSRTVLAWITRWTRCSTPYISFIEAHGCCAWVCTEWNLSTSRFDPVVLNDQQVSSESYIFLQASIYDTILFTLLTGPDSFHEHSLGNSQNSRPWSGHPPHKAVCDLTTLCGVLGRTCHELW